MPPTNISFATAIAIPSLPYSITQTTIHEGGVNFEVFYKFTAPTDIKLVGIWGFGGTVGSGYRPIASAWTSAFANITTGDLNLPIQIPVDEGNEYYIKFTPNDNSSPAELEISVLAGPIDDVENGNIIVNDDTQGFPLIVLSHTTDYTVVNSFHPVVAGEAGDILADGTILLSDEWDLNLVTYSWPTFVQINSISYSAVVSGAVAPFIRTCNGERFIVGFDGSGDVLVKDILATGEFGSLNETLTGITSIRGIAASNGLTILYHGSRFASSPVRRWDLSLHAPMSDLASGISGEIIVDILVLQDNTIVVLYDNPSTANPHEIHRYDTDGTLLNTYPYSTTHPASTFARLAYALDDPDSFWVWTHSVTISGVSAFLNIDTSSGTIITTRLHAEYESGSYVPAETDTPLARFGNSFSCPFMIGRGLDEEPATEIRVTQYVVEIATPHVEEPEPPEPEPGDFSGIYFINPNKSEWHDSYYNDIEKKIPDPTAKTGLVGE